MRSTRRTGTPHSSQFCSAAHKSLCVAFTVCHCIVPFILTTSEDVTKETRGLREAPTQACAVLNTKPFTYRQTQRQAEIRATKGNKETNKTSRVKQQSRGRTWREGGDWRHWKGKRSPSLWNPVEAFVSRRRIPAQLSCFMAVSLPSCKPAIF